MGGKQSELTSILMRVGQRDEAAFRRLYGMQSAALYGVALRIAKDPAMAMDALQDAFVQAWRNARQFDPLRGTAEAWLRSLVRHRAIDILHRAGRRTPTWEELEEERPDPGKDSLERLEAKADGQHLKRCLSQVEPGRRALLLLAYSDGMSHREIAEHTGKPVGTVKSSIRRILIALKTCMGSLP